ncbi:MAG: OmpA family protein, partial [candidate division FCPU426 bacterium]
AVKSVPLVSSNTLAPTSLRAGFGYTFDGSRPLAIDINTDYQLNDVEPPNVRASAEWAASRDLIFRAGYTAGNDRAPVGPSAGIGWMLGFVEFDYALYATGSLGISHLMTLRLTSVGSSRTAPMVVRGDPAAAWDCPPSAPPVEEKPMSMEAGLAAILALGFDAVWETPNVLLITLGDEKTHFDIDQDTIKEEGRQRLTALARILNEYDFPGATIRVDGHTDNTASRAWNLDLSLRRSQRVVNLMIDNGVKPETFSEVKAWGFDKPVAPNDTAEGRAKNRRVELRVRVIAKVVPIK